MSIGYDVVPVPQDGHDPAADRSWRWELHGSEVLTSYYGLPRGIEDSGVVAAEGAPEVLIWLLAHYEGWGGLDTDEPFTITISPTDPQTSVNRTA